MSVVFLLAIAWLYVVGLMAIAEATSPVGSVLGAFLTFVGYGVLPLGIALYLLLTPARRRRRAAQAAATEGANAALAEGRAAADDGSAAPVDPDGGGHAAGDAVAAKREEP